MQLKSHTALKASVHPSDPNYKEERGGQEQPMDVSIHGPGDVVESFPERDLGQLSLNSAQSSFNINRAPNPRCVGQLWR